MKLLSFALTALAAITAAAAPYPEPVGPVSMKEIRELEERNWISAVGNAALVGAGRGLARGIFGKQPTCECSTGLPDGSDCYYFRLPGVAEMCYITGGYQMRDIDWGTMTCLTQLAVNQKSTCIDAEGSQCAQPYTAIGNVQKLWSNTPWQSANVGQLKQEWANKMMQLFTHLSMAQDGKIVAFNLGYYIEVWPIKDDDSSTFIASGMTFRGTGNADC